MKAENYLTIQGWMRTELDLKGNELLIYAIIYGFSQTDDQKFTGSLRYIEDWCGITKKSVITALKELVDKGLISKEEKLVRGIKCNEYSANYTGGVKITPNNIDIYTVYSNTDNSSSPSSNTDSNEQSNTDSKQSNVTKENVFIERFDRFWKAYPVKAGKGEARKAWLKLKPSEELTDTMIKAVERARREDDRWLNGYIPNPATWLNQARWDDEPVKPKVPRNPNKILSERDVKEDEFETGFYADIMNRKRST